MKRLACLVAGLLLLGLAPAPALAWGVQGHRIVARLAEARLTPKARGTVAELLGGASLESVATWADEVRDGRPESQPWHFVDIPVTASTYDPERDCAGGCIITAIAKYEQVLGDPKQTKEARVEPETVIIPYRKGDLWGLVTPDGREVVPCRYDQIEHGIYRPGARIRVQLGGKWGMIDASGRQILPPRFDLIYEDDHELVHGVLGKKAGVFDRTGREIVPAEVGDDDIHIFADFIWVDLGGGRARLFGLDGRVIAREAVAPVRKGETFHLDDDGLMHFTAPQGWVAGYAIVDRQHGTIIRLDRYTSVDDYAKGRALVRISDTKRDRDLYGFIDEQGREVIPPRFEDADPNAFREDDSGYARVTMGGKLGLIDRDGREVTPFRYSAIDSFYDGFAIVQLRSGSVGLIDATGREVVPLIYTNLRRPGGEPLFVDVNGAKLMRAERGGHVGFIDTTGAVRVPIIYDDIASDAAYGSITYIGATGIVWAKRDGKYALVSVSGREIVPPTYTYVSAPSYSRRGMPMHFRASKGNQMGFVDERGHELVMGQFEWMADDFVDGLITVRVGDRWGLIAEGGRVVLPPEFGEIDPLGDGLAKVKRGAAWGIVDRSGTFVIPIEVDEVGDYAAGVVAIRKGAKWGLIGVDRRPRTPIKYDRVELAGSNPFRYRGLLDGKCGYLDETGREITPIVYDDFGNHPMDTHAWIFRNGVAIVSRDGKMGFIDLTGREVQPPKYDSLSGFDGGPPPLGFVKIAGREGFVSHDGREYFEP